MDMVSFGKSEALEQGICLGLFVGGLADIPRLGQFYKPSKAKRKPLHSFYPRVSF
jgi:hypothetical protein